MGALPDLRLRAWKRGDSVAAVDLNANFRLLADQIQTAMHAALAPDAATQSNESAIAAHELRLARIEAMLAMHARQRNEKEWAPLSYIGALLVRIQQLEKKFDQAVASLEAALAVAQALHTGQERRLARLEQQPEPAPLEEFRVLQTEHSDLQLKEHMLLAQIIALRHEVIILRDLAMAKDRQANRLEFAPMSYIGAILQRLVALEQRP